MNVDDVVRNAKALLVNLNGRTFLEERFWVSELLSDNELFEKIKFWSKLMFDSLKETFNPQEAVATLGPFEQELICLIATGGSMPALIKLLMQRLSMIEDSPWYGIPGSTIIWTRSVLDICAEIGAGLTMMGVIDMIIRVRDMDTQTPSRTIVSAIRHYMKCHELLQLINRSIVLLDREIMFCAGGVFALAGQIDTSQLPTWAQEMMNPYSYAMKRVGKYFQRWVADMNFPLEIDENSLATIQRFIAANGPDFDAVIKSLPVAQQTKEKLWGSYVQVATALQSVNTLCAQIKNWLATSREAGTVLQEMLLHQQGQWLRHHLKQPVELEHTPPFIKGFLVTGASSLGTTFEHGLKHLEQQLKETQVRNVVKNSLEGPLRMLAEEVVPAPFDYNKAAEGADLYYRHQIGAAKQAKDQRVKEIEQSRSSLTGLLQSAEEKQRLLLEEDKRRAQGVQNLSRIVAQGELALALAEHETATAILNEDAKTAAMMLQGGRTLKSITAQRQEEQEKVLVSQQKLLGFADVLSNVKKENQQSLISLRNQTAAATAAAFNYLNDAFESVPQIGGNYSQPLELMPPPAAQSSPQAFQSQIMPPYQPQAAQSSPQGYQPLVPIYQQPAPQSSPQAYQPLQSNPGRERVAITRYLPTAGQPFRPTARDESTVYRDTGIRVYETPPTRVQTQGGVQPEEIVRDDDNNFSLARFIQGRKK